MMLFRFLNLQGIVGLVAGATLAFFLVIQKSETRHWKKQSRQFEQLYSAEKAAFAETVADVSGAADLARAADRANAIRVAAAQNAINERTAHEFEARLADARARADKLRIQTSGSAADPGAGGTAPMPGLSGAPAGIAQATRKDRLSQPDRLIATEQAIQLDELIKWTRAQSKVDPTA